MLPSFYGGKTTVCLPLKYLVIRKLIALQSEIIEYSIWVFKNLIARVKSAIFDLKAHHELRTSTYSRFERWFSFFLFIMIFFRYDFCLFVDFTEKLHHEQYTKLAAEFV